MSDKTDITPDMNFEERQARNSLKFAERILKKERTRLVQDIQAGRLEFVEDIEQALKDYALTARLIGAVENNIVHHERKRKDGQSN